MAAIAAVGAAGSILGGILGGKGATKAAKIQAQASREQIAAASANRDYQYSLNTPTITAGNDATGRISSFLNGDATGLDQFRANTGYKDLLKTGMEAVSANAYARGSGDSGAALKALQERAAGIADRSAQGYLGDLQAVAAQGGQARSLVAGVGGSTVAANNAATQAGADASGNAALIKASNWQNILSQLTAQGASALQGSSSSYTPAPFDYSSVKGPTTTLPPANIYTLLGRS